MGKFPHWQSEIDEYKKDAEDRAVKKAARKAENDRQLNILKGVLCIFGAIFLAIMMIGTIEDETQPAHEKYEAYRFRTSLNGGIPISEAEWMKAHPPMSIGTVIACSIIAIAGIVGSVFYSVACFKDAKKIREWLAKENNIRKT